MLRNEDHHPSVEEIARVCHEVNRAYCFALGDASHLTWDELPEEIRASTRAGVGAVLGHPNETPESMHRRWATYKYEHGWHYGRVKSVEEKTHPNLLPYDLLPHSERIKDRLFLVTVRTMLS